MARSTSVSQDTITDDGSVIITVAKGEQIHLELTFNWLINMDGYTLTAKVVEGDNTGTGLPTIPKAGAMPVSLSYINPDPTDNKVKLVIPQTLTDTWSLQPTPSKPVYGFIGIELADAGVGVNQQIWKPLKGLVEVTHATAD